MGFALADSGLARNLNDPETMSLGEVCEALEYAGVDRGQRLWR